MRPLKDAAVGGVGAYGAPIGFFRGFLGGLILQGYYDVKDTISEQSQLNRDLAFCRQ